MQLSVIVAVVVAIISVVFALQNNAPVTVSVLAWRFDSSLALVLLLAFALGCVVVALFSTPATLRRQWEISRQKKRIAELESNEGNLVTQIAELQTPPPTVVSANQKGSANAVASPDKPDKPY